MKEEGYKRTQLGGHTTPPPPPLNSFQQQYLYIKIDISNFRSKMSYEINTTCA